MSDLLKNRVAVVTGSGRGLGRAYAMAIAKQGAKVVINDLGCETDGTGSSHEPADQVVEEIRQAGGTAVANYDSVITSQGAERIINTAIEKFGRLDILVNNAGVGRDRVIFEMTDEDFDIVLRTSLYGTFYCIRAASPIMKQQKYGRILNITSMAGFGIVTGEANYASAKESVAALTRTVARDLVKWGITCNAIRPGATTRLGPPYMEERKVIAKALDIQLGDDYEKVDSVPEDVAPMVVYLVSEQAKHFSSCIFDVFGNYLSIYDDPPQKAYTLVNDNGRFTIDELAKFLPITLTQNVKLPIPAMLPKHNRKSNLKPGARGWLLSGGELKEVQPLF
jgi:NAD(P)-dependent dehydrogenase (short-subunit alcohol dehydrogenase family)